MQEAVRRTEKIIYKVNPGAVITLAQVRECINQDSLDELKESIRQKGGLINPVVIAAFSRSNFAKYLDFINKVHNTRYSPDDFVAVKYENNYYFLVLIAGHRRLEAIRQINKEDNSNKKIYLSADIYKNVSVDEALLFQVAENTHERVPVAREAIVIAGAWVYHNRINPNLSVAEFARKTGRSESTVRAMLKFASLPQRLQNLAFKSESSVPFGVLVQIARYADFKALRKEYLNEKAMLSLAQYYLVSDMSSADFAKFIRSKIEHEKSAQADLFLYNEACVSETKIKKSIDSKLEKRLREFTAYLRKIDAALSDPDWGLRYSPVASRNVLRSLLKALQDTVFAELFSAKEQEEIISLQSSLLRHIKYSIK